MRTKIGITTPPSAKAAGRNRLHEERNAKLNYDLLLRYITLLVSKDFIQQDDEGRYNIAQANETVDGKGTLSNDLVSCRRAGNAQLLPPGDIHYIDVSPKQLVSAAAGLIPFLILTVLLVMIGAAANVHLLCAIQNGLIFEADVAPINPFRTDLARNPLQVVDGYIEPNDAPGFGLDIDEIILEQYPALPGPCYIPATD